MAEKNQTQIDAEESRKNLDKMNQMEIEMLKKMSPSQLKAQAQLELSMMDKEHPETEIEYYPNQKYIDKNFKGEKVSVGDLYALAAAQRRGEQTGVLKPEVAQLLLANALVEGRFSKSFNMKDNKPEMTAGDFGVNHNVYPGSDKKIKEIVGKMGLDMDTKPPPMSESTKRLVAQTGRDNPMGYKDNDVVVHPTDSNAKLNAKFAVTMMAIKALSTGGNPEEAVKAWNGKGPATELHLAKVKEANRVLKDPKNAAVLRAYQRALQYGED